MRRCHNIRLAITRRGMEAWVFAALSSKNSSELSVRSMVDILPLVAGLGSGLTDANDPPVWPVPLATVHLYCEGSINCLWGVYWSKSRQLYLSAPIQCKFGRSTRKCRRFR